MTARRPALVVSLALAWTAGCRANVDLDGQFGCADARCPLGYAGATEDVHFAGGAGDHEVGLLRFDLRAIPASAIVTAAELRLYGEDSPSVLDAGNQVAIHTLREPWEEGTDTLDPGTANWNDRSAGVAWTSEGAGPPGSREAAPLAAVPWSTTHQEHVVSLPSAMGTTASPSPPPRRTTPTTATSCPVAAPTTIDGRSWSSRSSPHSDMRSVSSSTAKRRMTPKTTCC